MQNLILTKNKILDNVHFFKENSEKDYCDTVQRIIQSRPFGKYSFYIFQFVKRVNDETGLKKMYHQARLTKPEPLPGTTLLRCNPNNPEEVTIIWTLPNQENFGLYKSGKLFQDEFVYECVQKYLRNPNELMKNDSEDLSDEKIREIYLELKKSN